MLTEERKNPWETEHSEFRNSLCNDQQCHECRYCSIAKLSSTHNNYSTESIQSTGNLGNTLKINNKIELLFVFQSVLCTVQSDFHYLSCCKILSKLCKIANNTHRVKYRHLSNMKSVYIGIISHCCGCCCPVAHSELTSLDLSGLLFYRAKYSSLLNHLRNIRFFLCVQMTALLKSSVGAHTTESFLR